MLISHTNLSTGTVLCSAVYSIPVQYCIYWATKMPTSQSIYYIGDCEVVRPTTVTTNKVVTRGCIYNSYDLYTSNN